MRVEGYLYTGEKRGYMSGSDPAIRGLLKGTVSGGDQRYKGLYGGPDQKMCPHHGGTGKKSNRGPNTGRKNSLGEVTNVKTNM